MLKLLVASHPPKPKHNLSYPCAMLHMPSWHFDPYCLNHMTLPISTHSQDKHPSSSLIVQTSSSPLETTAFLMLVWFSPENGLWKGSAFSLWRCYAGWLFSSALLQTGEGRMPWALYTWLIFILSYQPYIHLCWLSNIVSWWCYHLRVKGNCFVFWFYIWVRSLAPWDRISF